MLNKQASKRNIPAKNNGFINAPSDAEDIYGTSTAASKPQINFNRAESGSNFGGDGSFRENSGMSSLKQGSMKEPILLNQPSVDEFA